MSFYVVLFHNKVVSIVTLTIPIQLKNKIHTLRTELEVAAQKHTKEKVKYMQLGDSCQKLKEKPDAKVNPAQVIIVDY